MARIARGLKLNMIRRRRFLTQSVALLAAFAPLPLSAQQARRGIEYRLIDPQPVGTDAQIEVIEFFFYACPYCHELAPYLERWRKQSPPDVAFRRMPVVRHDSWVPLAKIYYALEAMGEAERLHNAVYVSYHDENMVLSRDEVIGEWAQKAGLDRNKFMAIYRSEETLRKVEAARAMTQKYDIRATPTIVVDGRFLTSSGMTDGVPKMMPVVDDLVRLARQERLEKSK